MIPIIADFISSRSFAWFVVAAAFIALLTNVRYLLNKKSGRKRFVKMINTVMTFYLIVMYVYIALGFLPVGGLAAGLARVAFIVLLALLSYESILDCCI